jgi:hypothetical protein
MELYLMLNGKNNIAQGLLLHPLLDFIDYLNENGPVVLRILGILVFAIWI